MERDGKPTSQTTSALILHGEDIPVDPNESPYIAMSRRIAETYPKVDLEADWSAAAFWYEYIAIHGGSLTLEGLKKDSLQGDKVVADIYARHFGVTTTFTPFGIEITLGVKRGQNGVILDFSPYPDLYPSVALACERLGIELQATGIENLRHKESDRIEAVQKHEVRNDHRMAMALMCADFPVSIEEQACIAKSYPEFSIQFSVFSIQHITPIKGVNDDNLGKKHALSKLIHAATTEYVWLHDDDVILPPVCQPEGRSVFCQPKAVWVRPESGLAGDADLIILPLRMESSLPLWVKSSARSDCRWPSVELLRVGLLSLFQDSLAVPIDVASRVRHRFLCNDPHCAAAVHSCVIRILRVLDHADAGVLRVLFREIAHKRHSVVSA
jgi:hypothetical protein